MNKNTYVYQPVVKKQRSVFRFYALMNFLVVFLYGFILGEMMPLEQSKIPVTVGLGAVLFIIMPVLYHLYCDRMMSYTYVLSTEGILCIEGGAKSRFVCWSDIQFVTVRERGQGVQCVILSEQPLNKKAIEKLLLTGSLYSKCAPGQPFVFNVDAENAELLEIIKEHISEVRYNTEEL